MSDKSRKSFTLDGENAEFVEARDNQSAFVNRLITHARKTGDVKTAGIELRLEQKRREKRNAEKKVENLSQDIDELERLLDGLTTQESAELQEAREKLASTPKDPTNPGIQNWADKLGMTPKQLIEKLDDSTT